VFTAADLDWMRDAQDTHLPDTCMVQAYSRTFSRGEAVEVWTDGNAIPCGLDMRPGSETHGAEMITVTWDATLRLSISTIVDPKDRIKVTRRFGEAITPLVFRIEGPVQRGPSGIRLRLRRVEV
jgi:hypothetical protein